jgi:phage tail-like protein
VALEVRATQAAALERNGYAASEMLPRAADLRPSAWLDYLPAPFHADPFVGRFLRIPQDIFAPLEEIVDTLAAYFDPRLTPAEMLPWLAAWVGVELDENWPLPQRRLLVLWAVRLYRWRGTRRGLREHLRLYTGHTPLIVENFDGTRLGEDALLGVNTRIGTPVPRPHTINVTVFADQTERIDERIVRQIIELEKPAHVAYTLDIRPAGGDPLGLTPTPADHQAHKGLDA